MATYYIDPTVAPGGIGTIGDPFDYWPTLVAGNTGNDIIESPLPGFCRHVRVRDQRAPHGNQIGFTLADEPVGHRRISNPADGNDRYLDFGFDGLGQMAEDPFRHVIRGMVKVTGSSVTGRYMEGIGARLCQKSGNLLCFLYFQSALDILITAQSAAYGEIVTHLLSNGFQYLNRKLCSALYIATIFIRSFV